MFLETNDQVGR
ncbi:unnamed protein product [Amaranthus hypochondriacus]